FTAAAHTSDWAVVHRSRWGRNADLLEEIRAPERNWLAVQMARDAEAAELARLINRQPLVFRHRCRGRATERVIACRTQATSELSQFIRFVSAYGAHFCKAKVTRRQCARLVEDHRGDIREMLEKSGAFDEDAVTRGHRDRCDRGSRRRKHERTRAG